MVACRTINLLSSSDANIRVDLLGIQAKGKYKINCQAKWKIREKKFKN